jgi:WW domain
MGFRISKRPVSLFFVLSNVKKNSSTKSSSPSKDGNPSDSSKITPTSASTGPKVIQNTLHRAPKPFRPPAPRLNDIDSFHNVPRGPTATTQSSLPLPPGWKAAFDQQTGKPYYYCEPDHRPQWEFPTSATEEPNTAEIINRNKTDLQKFIDEAAVQVAKLKAAEKAEEERKRLELEKEEKEAAEAKAKERAERKLQRDQRRSQRRTSETNTESAKRVKSKAEKELEFLVTPPSVQFD